MAPGAAGGGRRPAPPGKMHEPLPAGGSPLSVIVVRLGTPRLPGEGTRIGTVRRPPRGVPKAEFSARNWYDVWFPNLAPSPGSMKLGLAAVSPAQWSRFARK